jgi:ribonucleoside-diphosphate reductase alpha chain
VVRVPVQRQLPQRHGGHAIAVTIGGERMTVITGQRADGTLGEVRLNWGKQGSAQAGLGDAYATALSAGLRYGVPLADLLRPGLGLRFEPSGATDDPEVPWARSVADYLSRRLAIDWLPFAERTDLGVATLAERVQRAAGRIGADKPAHSHAHAGEAHPTKAHPTKAQPGNAGAAAPSGPRPTVRGLPAGMISAP